MIAFSLQFVFIGAVNVLPPNHVNHFKITDEVIDNTEWMMI